MKTKTLDEIRKKAEAERLRKKRVSDKAAERKEQAEAAAKARTAKKQERDKIASERKARIAELKKEREKIREERLATKEKINAEKAKRRKAVYSHMRKKLVNLPDGFNDGNYGFVPRVELEIVGDGTSIAAKFSTAGIAFADMRTVNGKTRFKIRKKDLRKGIAILDEMCYNYRISARYGIIRSFAFILSRIGLMFGLAASVVMLYIAYGYVWRVDISGNVNISSAFIESALFSAGYKFGNKKTSVDIPSVVAALGNIDGVADASCELIGTTMYVRVLEAKDYIEHKNFSSYTSKFDAKVTRIVTRSGNAVVKRGDVVKKGDMLICGDIQGTSGEVLYTVPCDAEVYGDVSISFVADISTVSVEYVPTGKVSKKTVFSLFGISLGKIKPPFEAYNMRSHTAKYDVLLPLYATTYEYEETAACEKERDIESVTQEFVKQKQEEMHFIGSFDSSYTITPTAGGLYSVHVFLSGETLISNGVA